jgi:hypothetical protein
MSMKNELMNTSSLERMNPVRSAGDMKTTQTHAKHGKTPLQPVVDQAAGRSRQGWSWPWAYAPLIP